MRFLSFFKKSVIVQWAIGVAAAITILFLFFARYDTSKYFEYKGDQETLNQLMRSTYTEDWDTFFKTIKSKTKVISLKVERKRYYLKFAKGDYKPGTVNIHIELKDMVKNKDILNEKYSEHLPRFVFKKSGESAQETAYRKAEKELFKRISEEISRRVFFAMLNYPEKKNIFMPIMEKRINAKDSGISYAAGKALLTFDNEAVSAIIRASLVGSKKGYVYAYIISRLKNLNAKSIAQLELLSKQSGKEVRAAIAGIFAQYVASNEKAKKAVLGVLKGKDSYVVQRTLEAIAKEGKKSAVLEIKEQLLQLMLNGKRGVDWRAEKALYSMENKAFTTLLKAFNYTKLHRKLQNGIRYEIKSDYIELFPILLTLKKNGKPNQKKGVKMALKHWSGSSGYRQALIAAISHKDHAVRLETVKLLAEAISKKRIRGYRTKRKLAKALVKALKDKDPNICHIASNALLLKSNETKFRHKAMIYKLKLCPKEERMGLLKKISSNAIAIDDIPFFLELAISKDKYIASRATKLLTYNSDLRDKIIPGLVKVLPKTPFYARENIIKTLSHKDYLPIMIQESWDPVEKEQVNITSILYSAKFDSKYLPTIIKIIEKHPAVRTRRAAVYLLRNFKNKAISKVPFLIELIKSGKVKGLESELFHFFKEHKEIEGTIYCFGGSNYTDAEVYSYLHKQSKAKLLPLLIKVQKQTKDAKIRKSIHALLKRLE